MGRKVKKRIKGKFGRIPLPNSVGGPHSTKKGEKGYNRKEKHKETHGKHITEG